MQRHCRHYSENSTLGNKKGECFLLDQVLRLRLMDSGPALSPVGLHENPEKSSPTVRPDQSYKSKPLICSVSVGKSFILSRMQVI